MALPDFSMRQLLEAGAHFGHQSHRWNPKMAQYIFGTRNNIHIIDLAQTVPMLHRALQAVSDTVAKGGRVLFVGTKRQASDSIADAAKRSAQYYVNSRWLGGMLTNWKTISGSISRLRKVDEIARSRRARGQRPHQEGAPDARPREGEARASALGGIKDMGGTPDLLFVIDTNKEQLAIQEAQRLGIPVAAIVDTNCDPGRHHLPGPGERRRRPRHLALLRPHRPRRPRRHLPRPGRARASISARPRTRSSKSSRRTQRCAGAGRAVRAPRRPARRAGRPDQAQRRRPAAREEAQRGRHLPLLAACGDEAGGRRRSSTRT